MRTNEVIEGLRGAGYLATKEIAYAVGGMLVQNIPLLVEGDPGCGKTCLAEAVAKMMHAKLLRVQFYEGLDYQSLIYSFDYERQLLAIEAMRGALDRELAGKSLPEAMEIAAKISFRSRDFLIARPVLQALEAKERCVLLLDEVDKSSEEVEYILLQVLGEYAVTIPEIGTIACPEERRPLIFLTSNRYRELSDATKRRCSYLYIRRKTAEEMKEILMLDGSIPEKAAAWAAQCLERMQNLALKREPSVPEAKAWIQELLSREDPDPEAGLYLLAKTPEDAKKIRASGILRQMPEVGA